MITLFKATIRESPVADQAEAPPPPFILGSIRGPKGRKTFFWETAPPSYLRVWMTAPPPFSQVLDPVLATLAF